MLSQYVIDIASLFRCYIWKLCANENRFIIDGWKQKNRKEKDRLMQIQTSSSKKRREQK